MDKTSEVAAAEVVKCAVRLRKPERLQTEMVVRCVDDLVSADHPVRSVAALVAKLDLSQFHEPIRAREGVAGRDATSPELLVSLWLYACTRGVGSARELERRCRESAAFQWLCGGVSVNYHLLSDFRVGHAQALDKLFTQVVASLLERKLVTVSRISQDGVRVRVGAGAGSFRRQERLQKLPALGGHRTGRQARGRSLYAAQDGQDLGAARTGAGDQT